MRRATLALLAAAVAASACASAPAPADGAGAPKLQVRGASLIVASSAQRLWSQNGERKLAMASTTKLMTVLVTLQHVRDLSTVFTQGPWEDQPGDSQIGLVPGEKMTVRDLLIAALLPSADDAAWDLAYNVGGGSIARFLQMMNARARALGLRHTHYTTPTGLDTPGNHTSPDDLVRLADYDMHHSAFLRRTVALRSARITIGNDRDTVLNTDTLLGEVPWIHGIKTGHTAQAGYVLVSIGTRDGMTLVGTVMGAGSEAARNAGALAVLEYGFANFHRIEPMRRGELVGRVPVSDQSRPAVIVAGAGFHRVVPLNTSARVLATLPRELSGPMRRGAVIGHARVVLDGKLVHTLPLVLARALPAVGWLTKVGRFVSRPATLVLLALIGAVVVLARRRRRPRLKAAGHMEER
ncbi:MAG: D-alanyl-D-alanine carboxypeptidase family protein [Solirubrobacteraceae bacterium]